MALALIPAAAPAVAIISTGATAAEIMIGEKNYNKARRTLTWGSAAMQGFLPSVYLPAQIGMIVLFTLILIFVFGVGVAKSIIAAYVMQGIIIMIVAQWLLDKFLGIGLGV